MRRRRRERKKSNKCENGRGERTQRAVNVDGATGRRRSGDEPNAVHIWTR